MKTSAALRNTDRLKQRRKTIQTGKSWLAKHVDFDDTAYRALLRRVAGVNSSKDIFSIEHADAVISAMRKLGFPSLAKVGKPPARLENEPYFKKIEAMLADMQLPWAYAEKIAENITGGKKPEAIKRLAWVREAKHLVGIVAALHGEKKKRLDKVLADLGVALAQRGLRPEWARDQAEAMGRLSQPWKWFECLETLRLITARLPVVTKD